MYVCSNKRNSTAERRIRDIEMNSVRKPFVLTHYFPCARPVRRARVKIKIIRVIKQGCQTRLCTLKRHYITKNRGNGAIIFAHRITKLERKSLFLSDSLAVPVSLRRKKIRLFGFFLSCPNCQSKVKNSRNKVNEREKNQEKEKSEITTGLWVWYVLDIFQLCNAEWLNIDGITLCTFIVTSAECISQLPLTFFRADINRLFSLISSISYKCCEQHTLDFHWDFREMKLKCIFDDGNTCDPRHFSPSRIPRLASLMVRII